MLEKVLIYGVIIDCGDGSVHPNWFLSYESAECYEDNVEQGWGESSIFEVETFKGSNIYEFAVINEIGQKNEKSTVYS